LHSLHFYSVSSHVFSSTLFSSRTKTNIENDFEDRCYG
jgi:hypothetical protein